MKSFLSKFLIGLLLVVGLALLYLTNTGILSFDKPYNYELLVNAGLSPYEALETGTCNSAEAMGKLDEFGTIEAGKRADMILWEANPLEDVGNVQKRAGVTLRGQWCTESHLQFMLDGLVESYKPALVDRLWPLSLLAVAVMLILRKIGYFSRRF